MHLLLAAPLALLAAPLLWRQLHQRRLARLLVHAGPHAIAESRFVRLGGVDQWIGVRGEDRQNPVLLILHGGPGCPYSIFTPIMRSWERHFTIVQWDRRGVGKTLGRNGKAGCGPLSFPRMVDDAIELAQHLHHHLPNTRQIVLGASMGNLVGIPLVKRRPDLFAAYGAAMRRGKVVHMTMPARRLVSAESAMQRLAQLLTGHDWRDLHAFLPDDLEDALQHRSAVAAALIASLELTKQGRIELQQAAPFGPIMVRRRP